MCPGSCKTIAVEMGRVRMRMRRRRERVGVVGVVEADVPLCLAGGVSDRHGTGTMEGGPPGRGGGRWRTNATARAGKGDETEAIAKGGTQEGEGVYKWLREVIRAQSEGDQRSPQSSQTGALRKLGRWNLKTRAPASPSPGKCKLPYEGRTHRQVGPSSATIQSSWDRDLECDCASYAFLIGTLTPGSTAQVSPHVSVRFRSCPRANPSSETRWPGCSSALLPCPSGPLPAASLR